MIEAMNIHEIAGKSWVGGKKNEGEDNFVWNEDESVIANWAQDYPSSNSSSSCIYQDSTEGFFRNAPCDEIMPYICQKKEYIPSSSRQATPSTTTTTTTTTTTASSTTCNCGVANRQTRIVGGRETEMNKYPWMVALVDPGQNTVWCGGSLVDLETNVAEDYAKFYNPGEGP